MLIQMLVLPASAPGLELSQVSCAFCNSCKKIAIILTHAQEQTSLNCEIKAGIFNW